MEIIYIKQSILGFFLLVILASCQKDLEVAPSKKPVQQLLGGKENFSIGMIMSGPEVLVGESSYFEPFIYIMNGGESGLDCGTLSLQKLNAQSKKWEDVKNAQFNYYYGVLYTIESTSYADEGYYRWHYRTSNNCKYKTTIGGSLYLDVVDEYSEEYL